VLDRPYWTDGGWMAAVGGADILLLHRRWQTDTRLTKGETRCSALPNECGAESMH